MKMKMTAQSAAMTLAITALANVAFVGCGKDKNNDPVQNVRVASEDRDIQNKNFSSACSQKPIEGILTGILTGGEAPLRSQKVVYRFEGANVTRSTQIFTTPDCSGDIAISFEEIGEFTLDTDSRTGEGAKFIDFDYKKLKMSIVSNPGVIAANAVGICGAHDWALSQQRDVTAQAADLRCYNIATPRHQSNIYFLEGNTLFFGTQSPAAVDPSKRPGQLNRNDGYVGQ